MLWALTTHGPRLVEILNGPLGGSLPDSLRAYFGQHVQKLHEVLSAARDLLVRSDRELRDQKALTTHYRRVRDAAFEALSPYVAGVRDTFKGACGQEVIEAVGFFCLAVKTPAVRSQLRSLVRQAETSHG